MKKITFLLVLLSITIGYSQELLTNGDFQTGDATAWSGNAANVVTYDNIEYFNEANVVATGNPYDVNLSNVVSLTGGVTYTLTFDAWTGAGQTRSMIVGIGLNESPYSNDQVTINLTETSQQFQFNLVNPVTLANCRVFFDMGADVGYVGIDNVSLVEVPSGPMIAAPTPPARPAADVVSVFSDAYSDIAVNAWGPDWGPYSARINDVMIAGNATKVINMAAGQVFAGIDFAPAKFDATSFTHFHMDYYIDDPLLTGQALSIKLSNHDGAGETSAIETLPTPEAGHWVQLDVPLDDFTAASANGLLDRNAIAQIVPTAARSDNNTPVNIYVDNIYFYKNTTASVNNLELINVKVYPNPTQDIWNIESLDNQLSSVQIFDIQGKKVMQVTANSNTLEINASILPSGLYFAKLQGENSSKTIKLIRI